MMMSCAAAAGIIGDKGNTGQKVTTVHHEGCRPNPNPSQQLVQDCMIY